MIVFHGNGFINTNDFFRNCDDTLSAFYSCDTFNSNGYNDWYLPSSLEMDSMYENIGAGSDKILYAKTKDYNGTIETLDISTEELIDFTVGEQVILTAQ